jgi:MoxR-like ATPase
MAKRIEGASFYERLIPQVRSSDQLFVTRTDVLETTVDGGTSIALRRQYGRAADAHLFFGDEFFKDESNPALLDLIDFALDGFIRTDEGVLDTPLMFFAAAGNEVPEYDGNLGAVWSRMTLRLSVQSLTRNQKLALHHARTVRYQTRVTGETGGVKSVMTLDDLKALQDARPFVEVPDAVMETVLDIYDELATRTDADFTYITGDDRRFGRIADVMQAHALINGRDMVTSEDLRVLAWILWDTPEQIPVLAEVLAPYTRTAMSEAQELVDALLSATGSVEAAKTGDVAKAVEALTQLRTAGVELDRLMSEASGDDKTAIAKLKDQVREAQETVMKKMTGA